MCWHRQRDRDRQQGRARRRGGSARRGVGRRHERHRCRRWRLGARRQRYLRERDVLCQHDRHEVWARGRVWWFFDEHSRWTRAKRTTTRAFPSKRGRTVESRFGAVAAARSLGLLVDQSTANRDRRVGHTALIVDRRPTTHRLSCARRRQRPTRHRHCAIALSSVLTTTSSLAARCAPRQRADGGARRELRRGDRGGCRHVRARAWGARRAAGCAGAGGRRRRAHGAPDGACGAAVDGALQLVRCNDVRRGANPRDVIFLIGTTSCSSLARERCILLFSMCTTIRRRCHTAAGVLLRVVVA